MKGTVTLGGWLGRARLWCLLIATASLLILATASPVFGQARPAIAPSRDELEAKSALEPRSIPRTNVRIEGDIERSPCALADPAYAKVRVTLSAVEFAHVDPVDPETLASAYDGLLGHEQPISVLCDIRDHAATILRRKGYLAAVQVPTQRIEDGKVRFEVLYAKLIAVRVRGDTSRSSGLFEAYLRHLARGQVFNRIEAERYLLLARDVPGYDVRLVLKPAGTTAGDMIGEVTLRRTATIVDASVQNYSAPATGRFAGQVRAEFYGLTGLGDRTQLSIYSTADVKKQQVLAIGHDFLLGGQGLRLGGRFTYAWTRPDLGAAVPPVRAETLFATVEASYPILRSLSGGIVAAVGADFVDQDVRFNGAPLSRDRLRVGFLRIDGDAIDTRGVGPGGTSAWRVSGSLEVRHGFAVLDASPNCLASPAQCAGGAVPPSLTTSDPTATLVRLTGQGEVRLTRRIAVSLAPRGQFTSASLTAFEQFSLGNYTLGRGYDPGSLSGDKGVGFAAEARATGLQILPKAQVSLEPYVFIDAAWVWNRFDPAGTNPQRLTSVGGGVRTQWADRARLDLTLAVPTRDVGLTRAGDVRVLVSLSTRLIPWRSH